MTDDLTLKCIQYILMEYLFEPGAMMESQDFEFMMDCCQKQSVQELTPEQRERLSTILNMMLDELA